MSINGKEIALMLLSRREQDANANHPLEHWTEIRHYILHFILQGGRRLTETISFGEQSSGISKGVRGQKLHQ